MISAKLDYSAGGSESAVLDFSAAIANPSKNSLFLGGAAWAYLVSSMEFAYVGLEFFYAGLAPFYAGFAPF